MARTTRRQPLPDRADEAIVDVLSRRVRVLSIEQVARTWCPESGKPCQRARNLVAALSRRGLVTSVTLLARPEITPTEPLAIWQPGLSEPDFGAVAWKLQSRRRRQAAVTTPCVIAASKRPPRETEVTHDLHLAAVFLLMCQELPTRAASWTFEDDLADSGQRLPDALVTDGKSKTVIECGGEYGRERLEDDHRFFARKGYGYEIW
jgi:hypothetical protein